MSMFSRMSDIIQSNINAMLDKAEDPEKVIRLIIQEMEETLVELRSVAAKQIAEQKFLSRKVSKLEAQAKEWQNKAQLAIEKDKESLARAALVERQSVLQKVEELKAQAIQVEDALGKLQDDTARLNEKLAEARAKQKAMAIRKNSVGVRLKAKQVEHSTKVNDAMARFDSYERRIDELEAQVDAYDLTAESQSLESQFRELEANDVIEKELAALKAKAA